MATIAIIVHPLDPFVQSPYIVHELARIWLEQGHNVVLVRHPGQLPPADVAILHVDLTNTPPEYTALTGRYARVINGRVHDISKRHVSRHLVSGADAYNGPVIVKTNANCAGTAELIHAHKTGANTLNLRGRISTFNYQLFASAENVPLEIWSDPMFVVEQFLPERRGMIYCLRTWVFLGSRYTHSLVLSDNPIVKGRNVRSWEPLGDVPMDLQRRRQELGFDYGKFDYVLRDGEAILFDANRTPTLPFAASQYRPRAELLAGGLADVLG